MTNVLNWMMFNIWDNQLSYGKLFLGQIMATYEKGKAPLDLWGTTIHG